jgi:hypothetical protein
MRFVHLSLYRYRLDVRGSNLGGCEIFRTRPDRLWGPPSLLCNGYLVWYLEVKRPGRGVYHPPPSSLEVKERVDLYLYPVSAFVACAGVNFTCTDQKYSKVFVLLVNSRHIYRLSVWNNSTVNLWNNLFSAVLYTFMPQFKISVVDI